MICFVLFLFFFQYVLKASPLTRHQVFLRALSTQENTQIIKGAPGKSQWPKETILSFTSAPTSKGATQRARAITCKFKMVSLIIGRTNMEKCAVQLVQKHFIQLIVA